MSHKEKKEPTTELHQVRAKVTKEDAYFHNLEQQKLAAAQARARRRRMTCRQEDTPSDGCPLEEVHLHGVVVDRCPRCQGIWLDAHELEDILNHLQKEQEALNPRSKAKAPAFLRMIVDGLKPKPKT